MILGVSFDSVEENRAFAEKFSFPYQLLSDTDRAIGVAYGAAASADSGAAKRISYLIGPDGVIVEAWASVDVKNHAGDVLGKL